MEFQFPKGRQPTTQQGLSVSELPDEVIVTILAFLGASRATDVFKFKTLCKTFIRVGGSDEVYQRMEVDSICSIPFLIQRSEVLALLREKGNTHMLFRDGMMRMFYVGDEAAGKEMMQRASRLGQTNATFVLGMLLMAEGRGRMEEARTPLNDEYTRSRGRWNVRLTVNKVRRILSNREYLSRREFPRFLLCGTHPMHPNKV